jgi:N-acetylglutamate synthase-like GNAT family acetyltransferase
VAALTEGPGYQLVDVATASDWRNYHSLRRQVLWEARGRRGYDQNHPDEYLPTNHPLLLKLDGRSIGTTRLDDFGHGSGAVRLVAIAPDMQRRGHGRRLALLVDDYARRLGLKVLYVNAAPEAVGYYEKLGWHACLWNEAELVGIAAGSTQMSKDISALSSS